MNIPFCNIPSPRHISDFAEQLYYELLSQIADNGECKLDPHVQERLMEQLRVYIHKLIQNDELAAAHAQHLFGALPAITKMLRVDAELILQFDPAAYSIEEVLATYPGFLAICIHRISHRLYNMQIPILPRMISEWAHKNTGIDINPGAVIGSPFFIDHGTGVVIGESAVIGNNVKIYQGVTLGALSVRKEDAKQKRHPTIEDNVVIYANSTILGGDTVIGKNSIIGGNTWITESVPPNSVALSKQQQEISVRKDKQP